MFTKQDAECSLSQLFEMVCINSLRNASLQKCSAASAYSFSDSVFNKSLLDNLLNLSNKFYKGKELKHSFLPCLISLSYENPSNMKRLVVESMKGKAKHIKNYLDYHITELHVPLRRQDIQSDTQNISKSDDIMHEEFMKRESFPRLVHLSKLIPYDSWENYMVSFLNSSKHLF